MPTACSTSTSTSTSSSWTLNLETYKAMFALVDTTSARSLSTEWNERVALIGIYNTAHLETHLPFTGVYFGGSQCNDEDNNGSSMEGKNDGGKK